MYQDFQAPRTHADSVLQISGGRERSADDRMERFAADASERFGSLRRATRRRLVQDAIRYTSAYRDVPASVTELVERDDRPGNGLNELPIVMAGHQPTLFHPGVWFKNFALDRLAKRHQSIAINLVVDNDVSSGVSIRIPQRDLGTGNLRSVAVAYDSAGGGVAYEQTAITDPEYFRSFDQRLTSQLLGMVDDPMIDRLWPHAVEAISRCNIAACALAQARHGLEAQLGLQTLEIPIGVVARDHGFARFSLELLSDLPRFVQIYNDQTTAYREHHGIRSSAHPVPNLGIDTTGDQSSGDQSSGDQSSGDRPSLYPSGVHRTRGDARDHGWLECPLWVYGDDSPTRRAVWARREGDRLTLGDRLGDHLELDLSDLDRAAETWTRSLSPQFKLRPRALLTTMYARWILSDLFLHGIGGGKYDQLGDVIAEQFFAIQPPPYYVTSATVHLPGVDDDQTSEDAASLDDEVRRLRRRLRDCRYQPERIDHEWTPVHRDAISRKATLLSDVPQDDRDRNWHQQIDAINVSLHHELVRERTETAERLHHVLRRQAERRLLASREHPFCIYPLSHLTSTFDSMLQSQGLP